jgi:HAD superfamily hydrolase (TIGR01490 family)
MPASYFDVDGTLVRTNLVHPTLYYLLNQANPQRTAAKVFDAVMRAPRLLLSEVRDRRLFNEELYALYKGMSEDRLLTLADDAYEKVLKPAVYPGARDLVRACRDRGHDVVLVSGALDFLMTRLQNELGATHVIANRLEFLHGVATGRMLPPVVAGPTKSLLLREHATKYGHDLDACYAYSDSYSDVPMLSVVGHPAAVNPDRALDRLARAYQWPVVYLDRA